MSIKNWWRSLGFYWQVYIFMVLSFGGIITIVEGVVEPFAMEALQGIYHVDPVWYESLLWIVSVLLPTLLLGFLLTNMVMRKLTDTVRMAHRLSCGDLGARITMARDDRDAFNQLGRAFNNMADSLQRLLESEKRLLADISHELRSPLTRMGVAAALLPEKQGKDGFDAMVRVLETEIEQMNTLVALLLDQGRERFTGVAGYSAVDFSQLAGEVAEAFTFVAQVNGKSVIATKAPGITVWGDPARLRMAVENVMSNALFYAQTDGTVMLDLLEEAGQAHLRIRDDGPGVPDEYLEDIFRAFFRVDESRARDSGGAGLGLALAKDAIVAMGGNITARNTPSGLEVRIVVPCASPRLPLVND